MHRWRVADFTSDLAFVLESLDRWDEASGLVERSLRLLTETPSSFNETGIPLDFQAPLDQTIQLYLRGNDKRGRSADANKLLDKLFADLRARNEIVLTLNVAASATKAGRHKEATTVAESIVTLRPNDANHLYDAACVFSLASAQVRKDAEQVEKYAKRAMELLKRAVDSGYRNVAHLKKDGDLSPLRDRKDYKVFVADLEAKFPPNTNPEAKKK
jgi:hypothetical protein